MRLFGGRLSIVLMAVFVCTSACGCFSCTSVHEEPPKVVVNLHHPRQLLSHPRRRRELIHALKTSFATFLKLPPLKCSVFCLNRWCIRLSATRTDAQLGPCRAPARNRPFYTNRTLLSLSMASFSDSRRQANASWAQLAES